MRKRLTFQIGTQPDIVLPRGFKLSA